MYKMVKTYDMCYYEAESKICFKTTISTVNRPTIFAGI